MTSPIIDFIEARLAEDEAAARATLIDVDGSGDWRADEHPVAFIVDLYRVRDVNARPVVEEIRSLSDDDDPEDLTEYVNGAAVSQHVARHDPARVLREVAAKRAIIEAHAAVRDESWQSGADHDYQWCASCGSLDDSPTPSPCGTLLALAAIWSDHPAFDPNWSTT